MNRLTDRRTAETLRSNIAGLRAAGIEPSALDVVYVRLADYEDAEEKRKKDKRGKWIEIAGYGGWGEPYYRCSACGSEWNFCGGTPTDNGWECCPKCGARMESDTE